jgi:hypothetical protein
MFYELRMYHAVPGRLDELVERIGKVLPPFFERHGFPPRLGQWTVSAGPSMPMLVWLLCWPEGFGQRSASFAGLGADPEWQAIRQETNGPGEMVRKYDLRILTPALAWVRPAATDGLPPEPVRAELFELRVYDVPVGSLAAANEILTTSHLPSLVACGATILGVFENQTGPSTPGITMLLGWSNFEERRKGLRRFESVPEDHSTEASNVLGSSACVLLEASPFGRPNHHLRPAR